MEGGGEVQREGPTVVRVPRESENGGRGGERCLATL